MIVQELSYSELTEQFREDAKRALRKYAVTGEQKYLDDANLFYAIVTVRIAKQQSV